MSFGLSIRSVLAALSVCATAALAQPCLEKNLQYWQAFPPGVSRIYRPATSKRCCAKNVLRLKPLFSTRPVPVVP